VISSLLRIGRSFDEGERRRLRGYGTAIGGLHVVGWGLIALYAPSHPVLGGLGVLAYSFGLRHAFDADHISAIDNVTRKLIAEGSRPLGVGFFFSLGHSTVVLALSLALAVAAGAIHHALPTVALYGGVVGAGISGIFLWAIGLLNAGVLAGIVRLAREGRRGRLDEAQLEQQLAARGLMSRLCGRRFSLITRSRQMYPVGLLFGLGFDTATEVGLLAITAGIAGGGVSPLAIVALPVLFAAGMSAMDTADGVFMTAAYGWALSTPVRKLYYNLIVTGVSVVVALAIGTVELLQVLAHQLALRGSFWSVLGGLNFTNMGYAVVGLFVVAWLGALAAWRWMGIEQRWQSPALVTDPPEA
jgi:nickel/cobalt transporter (NiCoT) family protein